jgi:hypothetical protein
MRHNLRATVTRESGKDIRPKSLFSKTSGLLERLGKSYKTVLPPLIRRYNKLLPKVGWQAVK